jgi:putative endonuclease
MYYTYILYSKQFDRYYIGQSEDITSRLERHNKGIVPSTKAYIPWELVYFEIYATRSLAGKREKEIKAKKSRKFIESLIGK